MLKLSRHSRRQVHCSRLQWKHSNSSQAQDELFVLVRDLLQASFSTFYITVFNAEQSQMGLIGRCTHLKRQVKLFERGPDCANCSIHSRIEEKFDGPAHKRSPLHLSNRKQPRFFFETTDSRPLCEDNLGGCSNGFA